VFRRKCTAGFIGSGIIPETANPVVADFKTLLVTFALRFAFLKRRDVGGIGKAGRGYVVLVLHLGQDAKNSRTLFTSNSRFPLILPSLVSDRLLIFPSFINL
jgi:hypothetical protein